MKQKILSLTYGLYEQSSCIDYIILFLSLSSSTSKKEKLLDVFCARFSLWWQRTVIHSSCSLWSAAASSLFWKWETCAIILCFLSSTVARLECKRVKLFHGKKSDTKGGISCKNSLVPDYCRVLRHSATVMSFHFEHIIS